MTAMQITFFVVSLVTLASAVKVVSSRKMMHAALWLVLALLGTAALFALLETRFFAVVQILVYIGAIAILIIFAVMLTHKVMIDFGPQVNRNYWAAIVASIGLFGGIVGLMSGWEHFHQTQRVVPAGGEDLAKFGQGLVDPFGFMIPFEVASILLVAALIGAIYISLDRKGDRS